MKRLALLVPFAVLLFGCNRHGYYPLEPAGYRSPSAAAAPPVTKVAPKPISRAPAWRPFDPAYATEYSVRPGDTLSEIAQKRLGTVKKLPLLMLANPQVSDVHRIAAEDVLVLPRPGFFAGPFLVSGEKPLATELLRWSKKTRSGFVGVEVDDGGPARLDRFILLEIRGEKSRVVFSSSNHRWTALGVHRYSAGWSWRPVDLDADGDLDLIASRAVGAPGGGFCAYAFHANGDRYTRYVLAENLIAGALAPGRKVYRSRTVTCEGKRATGLPGGHSIQPVRLVLRWTGTGFTRREVETAPARFVRTVRRKEVLK